MDVVVFGASGNIGKEITRELVSRGHSVLAVTRGGSAVEGFNGAVQSGDATDPDQVATLLAGHDAVISAVGPRHGVDDGTTLFIDAALGLITGARLAKVKRVLVVGGAGSLEVAPGVRLVDTPEFPEAWKQDALAQATSLEMYRGVGDLDWTYVSPAAFIEAGDRSGHYRTGGDQLLVDEEGESRITYADFASAVVDELERGQNVRRRMTVAY
ncbi:MAG: NAD(P)-dependent oxidoreductase [Acidimicrobiales bacterium]